MTIWNVEDLWLSRLFHQFRNSPHILGLIEILSDPLQDQVDVSEYILDHLSIDTAEGEALEFLGELIGVKRPPAQETRLFTLFRLGEASDIYNDHGFADDSDPTVTLGGYFVTYKGLPALDGSQMSDVEYRKMIRQKAATYRKDMTRRNLFTYLKEFGARCKTDDETTMDVTVDPYRYDDFDQYQRWYAENKGFKPAGIGVHIRDRMRDKDTV